MEIILIVCSYLLGSIPTGYILGVLVGVDVRTVGSGNVGATNVARSVGKGWGAVTLFADAAKGFIPVLVAGQLRLSSETIAIAAISAFLGHLFPLFLKFQGGKGVATALGIFLALAPMATLALAAVFAVVLASSRIVSLSSMVTALAAPISLWSFAYPPTYIAMGAFIAAMIVLRHRGNIQRLIAGTEPRFGSR
jgi:glycerol-3-phosphate acyltransferase PlsY